MRRCHRHRKDKPGRPRRGQHLDEWANALVPTSLVDMKIGSARNL